MKLLFRFAAIVLISVSATVADLNAQTLSKKTNAVQSRITAGIDEGNVSSIAGSSHPAAKVQSDLGPVSGDKILERVTLVFKMSDQQQQALETLVEQQNDPASANYHKWLTPAAYQAKFGISDSDLAKIKVWLQSHGLILNEDSSDHSMVVLSGSATQIKAAFHTEIHAYIGNGETHFSNASEVAVPKALAGIVLGVRGLNDFRPHPRPNAKKVKTAFTSSISGNHFLAPDDFATIYDLKALYSSGIDSTGQRIGVMGQSDISLSDIRTFRSVSGLSQNDPQVVLVPGSTDPGVVSGDIDEAHLDLEWTGAVARNATLIYVNSKNGALDSLQYTIQQNLAPVITISFGDCEQNFSNSEMSSLSALLLQANAQGQTVVGPTGDSGAADCDFSQSASQPLVSATHGLAVDFPGSSPYVTAIGGSTFSEGSGTFWNSTNNSNNGSAVSYIPETTWNDTATEIANGGSLSASGGGVSKIFSKPAWQVGLGVPSDGKRDVPDVTFAASPDHDGYLVCSQGSCVNGYRASDNTLTVFGGTSVGAPVFAGLVALLNQKTNSTQGNINPALYSLAGSSTNAIHDIVIGDNKVPCTAGTTDCASGGSMGFSAGAGFDLATGLGSLDAFNFVSEIASGQPPVTSPDFQFSAANATVNIVRGSSATDSLTISALNGFSGNVAVTCTISSALTNTTCAVTPSSITGSGNPVLAVTASSLSAAQTTPVLPKQHSVFWASGTFGLVAIIFIAGSKRVRRPYAAMLALLLISMVALLAAGCGSSSASSSQTTTAATTGALTGVVTVQATSGSTTHSVQVLVTVN
ncbi:MAG: Multicopper oxidase [Acidobacteriaceae bacterium]|nr:Multicopper oxidase [Acidobacteriaceae bacterium]